MSTNPHNLVEVVDERNKITGGELPVTDKSSYVGVDKKQIYLYLLINQLLVLVVRRHQFCKKVPVVLLIQPAVPF